MGLRLVGTKGVSLPGVERSLPSWVTVAETTGSPPCSLLTFDEPLRQPRSPTARSQHYSVAGKRPWGASYSDGSWAMFDGRSRSKA